MDLTPLFCDYMSSIYLARNLVFHAHTKHIEVHYHFIRERVLVGNVGLQHITANLQTTDIFTKAIGADKLWQFMTDFGIRTTGATMIPQLQPRISTWFGDPTVLGDPRDSTFWS